MSKNKNKDKGTRWENEVVDIINEKFPSSWRRVPMSGALGTTLDIPSLKGDVSGRFKFDSRRYLGECKSGYGVNQMTIQKEWFDKIQDAARETGAFPIVFLKFSSSTRKGMRHIVCMDINDWLDFVEDYGDLYERTVSSERTDVGDSSTSK